MTANSPPWLGPETSFLQFLQLERGLADNTLDAYRRDLRQCAAYLADKYPGGWSTVPAPAITDWLASLSNKTYSVASLARKLTTVRMLARHLVRENMRQDDFGELLKGPRLVRKLPGALNMSEVDALLQAPDSRSPNGIRDRAMLETMYSSGLRVSELCALSLQSIDLENGFLRVFGKGAKERVVPLGSKAVEALQRYLEVARPKLVKARTGSDLFLSQWGQAMSRKTFWVMIRRQARMAGINKAVKPHLLRHSFASHLLNNGADLRAIQEMLGHADISTTQIYTAIKKDYLSEEHAHFHPRSKAKVKLPTDNRSPD